jgi:chromatin remodeling complex protein RSC6
MTAPNNTSSQDDAQAFHVVYDDIPRDKETVLVATIHLYKRMGPKERYRPSEALSQVLFPPCAPKNAEDDKKKKKGMPKSKISLSMDELTSPKKKLRTQPKMNSALDSSSVSQSTVPFSATNLSDYDGPGNLGTSAGDNQGAPTVPRYATIPMENSIQIPTLLTMEEIMGALFRYIKDRDLWDIADASLINNNQHLVSLFDCQSMTLAQMKGMLLSRKLIEKVGSFDHPIVLTYVIRRDTGMPRINDQLYAAVPVSLESTQSFTVQSVYQNKLVDDAITGTMENPLKSIVGPYPNYLTFDMDIDVPMLFPFRTREILGRIKRREFEWTNARTKALRMVQASRVEEELIKEKLEDIVKGRGLSKEHIPILLALAKTSSTGSQAQVCAHIDARIAFLMQRLEYHVGLAKACWGVVDGLSNI